MLSHSKQDISVVQVLIGRVTRGVVKNRPFFLTRLKNIADVWKKNILSMIDPSEKMPTFVENRINRILSTSRLWLEKGVGTATFQLKE